MTGPRRSLSSGPGSVRRSTSATCRHQSANQTHLRRAHTLAGARFPFGQRQCRLAGLFATICSSMLLPVSPSVTGILVKPARRLRMLGADHWWTPAGPQLTLDWILTQFWW